MAGADAAPLNRIIDKRNNLIAFCIFKRAFCVNRVYPESETKPGNCQPKKGHCELKEPYNEIDDQGDTQDYQRKHDTPNPLKPIHRFLLQLNRLIYLTPGTIYLPSSEFEMFLLALQCEFLVISDLSQKLFDFIFVLHASNLNCKYTD